jgi:LTXXQ motif family protein
MSRVMTMTRRWRTLSAVLMLAGLLTAGSAWAQELRPGQTAKFDQAQCLREAERVGRNMIDRLGSALRESEAVKELEAAATKVKGMLRDACAAGSVLTSEEARATAEKMVEAAVQAMRSMRAALDGFYASLSDEQKRKLDSFMRHFRTSEPKPQ